MMEKVLICAVAENGVIGQDGRIPWDYPEDLQHFREETTGHPVILGRKTFENIVSKLGTPLPKRKNIVLSQSGFQFSHESVTVCSSFEDAINVARKKGETVYIAGGESVYDAFSECCETALITRIPESPPGDSVFPVDLTSERWVKKDEKQRGEIKIEVYTNRNINAFN